MPQDLIPLAVPQPLTRAGLDAVPALFAGPGDRAAYRFIEFFTANIRNKNTRTAYTRAARCFSTWCDARGFRLEELTAVHVAAYVEDLGQLLAKPTVKQHLAGLRMLFDWLVIGQVISSNPATSVRGPKYVISKGKTPVLTQTEARSLFDAIDHMTDAEDHWVEKKAGDMTVAELRDRALIGVMVYSFARIGAVLGMDVEDYYQQGKRWWIRLHEKGGKHHEVPAHHKLEHYLDVYLEAAGLAGRKGEPLFRTLDRRRQLTGRRLTPREALAMIKRRARAADLGEAVCCHTFRATGITNYLENQGTLDKDQPCCLLRQKSSAFRSMMSLHRTCAASHTAWVTSGWAISLWAPEAPFPSRMIRLHSRL
jgi:site-specific recombinase XerD